MLLSRLFNQSSILSITTSVRGTFTLLMLVFCSMATNAQIVLADRSTSNTHHCNTGDDYGAWLNFSGLENHYTLSNGNFVEYLDGTASFTGTLTNNSNDWIIFYVDVTLSGRTFDTPTNSPKSSSCGNSNTSDWYYYTATNGTLTGAELAEGASISLERAGPSFQAGAGANVTEGNNIFGACGWLTLTIDSQPTDGSLVLSGDSGDFNFNLSGNALTPCDNITDGGTIVDYEVSAGPFTAATIASGTAPSGGTGAIEYMWLKSNDPNLAWVDWTLVTGANGESLEPGYISETTYFLRCSRRLGCMDWVGESNIIAKIINGDGVTCEAGAIVEDTNGNASEVTLNNGATYENNILGAIDEHFAKLYDNGDYLIVELQDELSSGQQLTISWKSRLYNSSYAGHSGLIIEESSNGTDFSYNTTLETSIKTYNVHQTITLNNTTQYLKLAKADNTPDLDIDAVSYATRSCTFQGSIGDRVWEDLNANGIQEDGEPNLAGVFVFLEDVNGNPIPGVDFQFTGLDGAYLFDNLPVAKYVVRFATPAGYLLTKENEGGSDALDSDAGFQDGRTAAIDLNDDLNVDHVDAGYYKKATLIGRVWFDTNSDDLDNNSEDGVIDVVARLFTLGTDGLYNTVDDLEVASQNTDNLGFYTFGNLEPNLYYVKIEINSLPIGYSLVTPNAGDENIDSDVDQNTGMTLVFNIESGDDKSSVSDAGLDQTCSFIPTATVGDITCEDFPVAFEASPEDVDYNYFWEFFDDENASYKLGDSNLRETNFTWNSSGSKSFTLKVTDKDGCFVSFAKTISITPAEDSECAAILPVEFLSFTAEMINDSKVKLDWSTAWEENNNFFEVQRSTDGTRFQTIGSVDGNGTTELINNYKFFDEAPFFGRNYYRLKQVDFNGTIDFSEVVSILIDNAEVPDVIAHPNPTKDVTNLRVVTPFAEDATVEVVNSTGQVLEVIAITAGTHTQQIDLSNYQPGFYFLNIKYNGYKKLVHRVLKIRD